jgi:hypothetical protein
LQKDNPTSYRESDVYDAFNEYFYHKCYLTEKRYEDSAAMEVDHFEPQKSMPSRTYDWTNLFPIDNKANKMRPKQSPPDGYLNPCESNEDVETEIIYSFLDILHQKPHFVARNPNDQKAKNTAELLEHLHNGSNPKTNRSTLDLRKAIEKQCETVSKTIDAWLKAMDGSPEKNDSANDLKDLLSRKSPFTMLCRSLPAVRQFVPSDFLD